MHTYNPNPRGCGICRTWCREIECYVMQSYPITLGRRHVSPVVCRVFVPGTPITRAEQLVALAFARRTTRWPRRAKRSGCASCTASPARLPPRRPDWRNSPRAFTSLP